MSGSQAIQSRLPLPKAHLDYPAKEDILPFLPRSSFSSSASHDDVLLGDLPDLPSFSPDEGEDIAHQSPVHAPGCALDPGVFKRAEVESEGRREK